MAERKSIEEILRAAKERETLAAQQTGASKIAEIEEGAVKRTELMAEGEAAAKKSEESDTGIASIEGELKSLAQKRAQLEADENLKKHPDLQVTAFAALQEREQELQTALERKRRDRAEAETIKLDASAGIQAAAEKVKPYLGGKEIPAEKLDAVWKHVESERKFEGNKNDYQRLAKLQAADIAEMAAAFQQGKEIFWDLNTQTVLHHLPEGSFDDPRIDNFFIGQVDAAIRAFIAEKKISRQYYANQKVQIIPIDDASIEKIMNAALRVKYGRKTLTIWDKGKDIPREAEPALPEVIVQLTPDERKAVVEMIQERTQTKETLREALRLSEYSAEADEYFRGQAAEEDAEYVRRKLEEKNPEADAAIRTITEQETTQQEELDRLGRLKTGIVEYGKISEEARIIKSHRDSCVGNIRVEEGYIQRLQEDRDALPKRAKILGGGPKDKKEDARLTREILELERSIEARRSNQAELEAKLKPLEGRLAGEKQTILELDKKAFDENGALKLREFEVDIKITKAKSEMEKIQSAKKRAGKAKELWEQGKFLGYSIQEMQFIAPENGGRGEIDNMAASIAGPIEKSMEQYRLWQRFPDTNWTIKNAELKQEGARWDHKVYGGDWNELAKLRSEKLSWLLAQKVRTQLTKKFGDKVGNLRITVE